MDDPLLCDIAGGVALLTLNRPQALNALNDALRLALVATLARLDADRSVRAIVLTGAGRAFCAGLDVRELEASGRDVTANVTGGDVGGALTRCGTPVIAAVNGLAVTGGFEIALACDMIVAARSAWFRDTHAQIGLLPGWGLSQRLPRTAGANIAKEISLTGRKVDAAEAARIGFVNRVAPDDRLLHDALTLAREIAQWPRTGTRDIKALIDGGLALPLGEALKFELRFSRDRNRQVTITARA
ncbi:enoyl-CoA hydratase [Paracoccus sp. (in: a-proteobacteria)]|uniref:enoyl-CoA hydratase n=1 Tax=Paracoccus sp. TaxID=267 RepID=UPI003A8B4D2B